MLAVRLPNLSKIRYPGFPVTAIRYFGPAAIMESGTGEPSLPLSNAVPSNGCVAGPCVADCCVTCGELVSLAGFDEGAKGSVTPFTVIRSVVPVCDFACAFAVDPRMA